MARRLVHLLLVATVSLCATPARAQDASSAEAPAHISVVDGAAVLERDGQTEPAPLSMPLLAGDRIRTENGRVEVLFTDGSALHLDDHTVVDFQSDEVLRLLEGRVRLSIAGPSRQVSYRVDAPSGWVHITEPGEFRVAIIRGEDVELAVLRGGAELVNEAGRTFIGAGERTFARAGAAPSPPYVFNSAAWDSFDRWSETRRDQRLGVSAQYLPTEVRPYAAAFDDHGSWRYEASYGYVWYPRVHVGWRPYHRGRWVGLRPYGWTWVAADPWGWPTHHYGRWGISAGAWFWIPGRQWSPAWVSWAYAPDYVSWCPLGWNDRPVLQIVNVNIFGGRRYSPWDAWTVVPRRHFYGSHVTVAALGPVRISPRVYNTFVVRDAAPDVRRPVGRSAVPIRAAGRYAVPRDGSAVADRAQGRALGSGNAGDRRGLERGTATRAPAVPADARQNGSRAVARERSAGAAAPEPSGRGVIRRDGGNVGGAELQRGQGAAPARVREAEGSRPLTAPPRGTARAVPRSRSSALPSGVTRESDPPASVTAPPDGAVRAVPRGRTSEGPSGAWRGGSADESPRRQPQGRTYSAPPLQSIEPEGNRPGQVDVYRTPPAGGRRAPDGIHEDRGRALPRGGGAPGPPPEPRSAPSYRRSDPGPSRAPRADPPPRPSGGDRGGPAGGRQRSGEGAPSSGQARRRG